MIPEPFDVFGPQGGQQGLLLENRVVGIGTASQLLHQETLDVSLITAKHVIVVQHMGNRLTFSILGNEFRVPYELLGLLRPVAEKHRLLQNPDVFTGQGLIIVENGTIHQQLVVFRTEAKLHTHLHRQAIAVVQHAVLVVNHRPYHEHQPHAKGSIVCLRTILVEEHEVTLFAES